MIKNRKFFTDIILNIIAGAMPMAMLQLIIYPKIAKVAGGDEYGLMLTIYSVWIMVSNSLGNVQSVSLNHVLSYVSNRSSFSPFHIALS